MKKIFTLCFDRSVIDRFSFRCRQATLLLPLIAAMAASVFMFSTPAFAYEEDTHFNMTYVICRSVGFTADEAMIVAAVDQGMDDSAGTVANGGTGGIIPNVDQEWMWHALDGYGYVDGGSMHASGIIARRDQLFQYALNEPDPRNRLILLGVFFHFQQDTWGHRHHYDSSHLSQNNYTTYNTPWGHALDYHQPDRPPFDPVAAMMDLEDGIVFARTFLKQAIGRAPGSYLATYAPQGGSVDTSWSQDGKYYHQISLAGAAPNSSRLYLLSLLQAQINAYTCSTDPYYGFRCTANEANVNNVRLALQTVAQNFEQYRSGGIPNPTINIPTTAQKVAAGFTNMTSVYITNMFSGTARFIAIGTDKNLYKLPTLPSGWVQVPNSQAVIGITALPDGSVLGVGTDKFLWRRATLSSNWVQVPNSGSVTAVTVMLDGTILGVGTDKLLYQRATLNANWVQVPNSGSVTGVAIMADGSILGIGTEQGLWTRATLTSNWVQVPNSQAVIAITVMADGSIVGVGTDNFLWRRATLNSGWVRIPNTGVVTGVTAMLDGSLLGIGTEQGLWQLANLNTGWIQVPNSGSVTAITPMPDGSLLGIGTDKFLYQRANLNSNWVQVPNSGSVVSIAVMQDGSILGVGTDSFLWRRATLNSNWVQVPNSGVVSGVAVMPDGSILGIGTEKGLWRRANLNSNWVQIPNSGLVTAITVMADGSILGVGTDNFLWRRANLNSNWVKILNSNAVIDVAVMP